MFDNWSRCRSAKKPSHPETNKSKFPVVRPTKETSLSHGQRKLFKDPCCAAWKEGSKPHNRETCNHKSLRYCFKKAKFPRDNFEQVAKDMLRGNTEQVAMVMLRCTTEQVAKDMLHDNTEQVARVMLREAWMQRKTIGLKTSNWRRQSCRIWP